MFFCGILLSRVLQAVVAAVPHRRLVVLPLAALAPHEAEEGVLVKDDAEVDEEPAIIDWPAALEQVIGCSPPLARARG